MKDRQQPFEDLDTCDREAAAVYDGEVKKYYASLGLPYEPPKPMTPEELAQFRKSLHEAFAGKSFVETMTQAWRKAWRPLPNPPQDLDRP